MTKPQHKHFVPSACREYGQGFTAPDRAIALAVHRDVWADVAFFSLWLHSDYVRLSDAAHHVERSVRSEVMGLRKPAR